MFMINYTVFISGFRKIGVHIPRSLLLGARSIYTIDHQKFLVFNGLS